MTEIEGVLYPKLHLMKMNAQVKGLLTIIRDREQPRGEFIFYADRLIRLLIEEGLSYLEFEPATVITPAGSPYEGVQVKPRICGVSMVRAGESMEAGLRQVCKKIRIGKILVAKDEDGVPHFLFGKFPQDIAQRKVFLLDPLLATGASVTEATKVLMEHGVAEENIIFLNLIAAPQGIKSYTKRFPKITIVTVEIDTTLSNRGVSLPGIGVRFSVNIIKARINMANLRILEIATLARKKTSYAVALKKIMNKMELIIGEDNINIVICVKEGMNVNMNPTALGEELYDSILQIDEYQCFELIEAGADVNYRKPVLEKRFLQSETKEQQNNIERDWACLHVAVECNVISVVKMLLENGAQVDCKDQKGNTPLHWAAKQGRFDCVDELIEHKAPIHSQNDHGFTPLHLAALSGYVTIIQKLMEAKAIIDAKTIDGWTPLHLASFFGHTESASFLINNMADINSIDIQQMTPLHKAVIHGSLPVTKLLLASDADPNQVDQIGETSLHKAILTGHTDICYYLLTETYQDETAETVYGNTALHYAIFKNNLPLARLLITMGWDVNHNTLLGNSPLMVAVLNVQKIGQKPYNFSSDSVLEMVMMLIERSANLEIRNEKGESVIHIAAETGSQLCLQILFDSSSHLRLHGERQTPLHSAARGGNLQCLHLLLDRGFIPSCKDENGVTPVHLAAANGNQPFLTDLLIANAGASIPADKSGSFPIHEAAKNGHHECIDILLKDGAEVTSCNFQGETALHFAAAAGCCSSIRLLVRNNAHPESVSIKGETPMHYAARFNQTEAISLLLSFSVDVNCQNNKLMTPLHESILNSHVQASKLLIEHNVQIDARDKDNKTAFFYAATKGSVACMQLLIEKGTALQAISSQGHTALHYASAYGHYDIVKLLTEKMNDIDTRCYEGWTPLHLAVNYGFARITTLLITQGCSVVSRDTEYNTPIHKASLHGAHDIVKILLANEAEVNALDLHLNTPLHFAAMKGSKMTIKVLLEYKASPELYNREGFTAIHYLVKQGHIECLEYLLQIASLSPLHETKSTGDILLHVAARYDQISCIPTLMERNGRTLFDTLYHTNRKGRTALHVATKYANMRFVRELINLGADIEAEDSQGKTPLWLAAAHGHSELLSFLIESNANIFCTDNDGIGALIKAFQKYHFDCVSILVDLDQACFFQRTSLGYTISHLAAIHNCVEILDSLLQHISPCEQDMNGNTPLHLAAEYDNPEIVKKLVEHVGRKEARNYWEQTPLHRAACGSDDSLLILLHAGYDANSVDKYGHTPLHLASASGTRKAIEHLVRFDADVNAKTIAGNTMLHFCARNGNIAALSIIAKQQSDILAKNNKGNNALHCAAKYYQEECIAKLIDLNLSVTEKGYRGYLPLHYAAKNGNIPSYLISNTPEIDHTDDFGNTALHIASLHGNMDFCELLIKHGADPLAQNDLGWRPLHMAASMGQHPLIVYFISQRSNVNAVTIEADKSQTALHIACHNQQMESVRVLLNAGASPAITDADKNTPIHIAAKSGNIEILKMLLLSRHAKDAWNIANADGKIAIHYALVNNDEISSRLLLKEDDEYGVEIWMRPQSTALTCIHIAALIGDSDAISQLIKELPVEKITAIDDRNRTPLDIARTTNHPHCVDLLESFFAKINKESN